MAIVISDEALIRTRPNPMAELQRLQHQAFVEREIAALAAVIGERAARLFWM